MGIEKVGVNIGKEIIAWAKTGKGLLATRPVKVNILGLQYVPALEKDVVQLSRNLEPADKELFTWATRKPKLTFDEINPESLVLVRMTNEFPKNGEVLSSYVVKDANGLSYPRTTLHFTLNRSVAEDLTGLKWNTMDYAIIAPFQPTLKNIPKSKIIGGIQEDFMIVDRVKLPQGSTIVKYNPDIPEGQFRVSDIFEGIKMVETSNRNVGEAANLVVEKMGYTTSHKALEQFLSMEKGEALPFLSRNEEEIRRFIREINERGGIKEKIRGCEENIRSFKEFIENTDDELSKYQFTEFLESEQLFLRKYKILEKYLDRLNQYKNSWSDFCLKNGYINRMHCETPMAKFDASIMLVDAVETLNKNSWGGYKQRILKILNEAISEYPKDKYSSINYNKIKTIIEEAENPKIAIEKIREEFKIKSSPQLYYEQDIEHIFDEYEICFNKKIT